MKKTLTCLCLITLCLLCLCTLSFADGGADEYIAAVNAASALPTLAEREQALAEAEALYPGESFDGYPGMAEALAKALKIKDAVKACNDFIDATYRLRDLPVYATYTERKAAVEEVQNLYALCDTGYTGVSDCYESVKPILASLDELERFMADYLIAANRLDTARNYAELDNALRNLQRLSALDDFAPDHPTALAVEEKIEAAEEKMEQLSARAAEFLLAVQQMSSKGTLYEGLSYALPYYLAADGTVSSIYELYNVYKAELTKYNSAVNALNAAVRGE